MYKIILFRLDGQYVKEIPDLVDALKAFEEVVYEPDPKRVCAVLAGPDTWLESYL